MRKAWDTTGELTIEELTSSAQVNAVRHEWTALCAGSPGATPFQSPAWLLAWWKHLGEGELLLLAVRDSASGKLVAIAPFLFQENPGFGCRLLLVGCGITDYLDVVVDPERTEAALVAILNHVQARAGDCVEWDFQQLRPGSPLLGMAAPETWASQFTVQEVCPVLPLPDSLAHLNRVVPRHMLEKLAYYRRRLQKLAPARIEVADSGNFEELFDSFLALHRARWAARGEAAVLAGQALEAFHREVAEASLQSGTLRLFGLRIAGEIQASLYAFADRHRTYFYLSGFNPELAPFSPGSLLIGHAIEDAVERGAAQFDFLRGREAYKYMWGARGQLNYRKRFFRPAEAEAELKTEPDSEIEAGVEPAAEHIPGPALTAQDTA